MTERDKLKDIPREMHLASVGSFPFSPGTMSGHEAFARLYSYFRRELLKDETIESVFGTNEPTPPKLALPENHLPFEVEGLNKSVWKKMLRVAFVDRPKVDYDYGAEISELIALNANSDVNHFEERLAGNRSVVITGRSAPSLVRSFLIENRFPINTEFFQWLIPSMTSQVIDAHSGSNEELWENGLKGLVLMWNAHFPQEPFIPKKK